MKVFLALSGVLVLMGCASVPVSVIVPEFVKIEGGTFTMGEPDAVYLKHNPPQENKAPQHTVTVSSFYMSKYEITQREFMVEMIF